MNLPTHNIITFVLSTFGMTYFVARSDLFKFVREFISSKKKNVLFKYLEILVNCIFCCSIWTGLITWVLNYYNINIVIDVFSYAAGSVIIYEVFFKIKK